MKEIVVNLKNESDLYEKYNDKLSRDLIEYLLKETKKTKGDLKIIVNTSLNIKNIEQTIKDGLMIAYEETKRFDDVYDNKQISFFIMGFIFLLFSSFIKYDVIKEIIIIIGWFVIWEGVDIALNLDTKLRINRKKLKKLIDSEVIINKK
ncbi:MAG: hypothetical protein IJY25_04250 [Bacilli bacterium]|nr:hypothetical protein [Bacilli bacterium]